MRKLVVLMMLYLLSMVPVTVAAEQWGQVHQVVVDRSQVLMVSKLELGWTWTHIGLDDPKADPQAVARATALLLETQPAWQNTHIIGWGVGNIHPAPGEYVWDSLDARIERMRKLDIPIVITLCTAPGWMKVKGNTWNMEDRPREEYLDAFAQLCVQVAKRYPDVRVYQIWNELKGYWSNAKDNWDIESYTVLYNKVYDALKAHDSTLKVGGLYTKISGTGSARLGYQGPLVYMPIGTKDTHVVTYWLNNMSGADFICVDRGTNSYHDKNAYSAFELIGLTDVFSKTGTDLRQWTQLPIWWSEYYGTKGDDENLAAGFASIYRHMILGHASVALCWNPFEGEVATHLFTSLRNPDGGQPLPHYYAYKAIAHHFGKGKTLYQTSSSTDRIEVLASNTATMLINKYDVHANVSLDGKRFKLKPYEVRLILPGTDPSSSPQESEIHQP